jgi:hypothetical protein
LVVDGTSTNQGIGIGVAIDNEYIVLGKGGKHAGNTNIATDCGLTLGGTYKQKIANAPVYIPPAKGQILYLVGTESKIINAISGCLQDIILTYGESFKFNDATWIFPQSVQLYQEIPIWNTALKATAAAILRNFVDDNRPYLPWSVDDKKTLDDWIHSTENNKNDIIINSNGFSQFQIYVFPIPSHKAYMWPNTLISWVDSSVPGGVPEAGLFDNSGFSWSKWQTKEGDSSKFRYVYTNWDGCWKNINSTISGKYPSATTDYWEWNSPSRVTEYYDSPSSFFNGLGSDPAGNELPSSIWKHDIKDYDGKYSWQVPGSPDYFNPYELIKFTTNGTVHQDGLSQGLKGLNQTLTISDLYNINYFKYSPGIWNFNDVFRSNFETFTVFTCYRCIFIPYCIVKSFWCKPCTCLFNRTTRLSA